MSDVVWMKGEAPSLARMHLFSEELSREIGRCIAYRIKDKRRREVWVELERGEKVLLGEKSQRWLFGVAAERRTVSAAARARMLEAAKGTFASEVVGHVRRGGEVEGGLFG